MMNGKKRESFKAFSMVVGLGVITSTAFTMCGCSQTAETKAEAKAEGKINVVATTTMLNDLVEVIGGDKVESTGLMGAGIDPHLYQASAGDVSKMEKADVVVYNGVHLEGKMGEIFEGLESQDKDIICAEDGIEEGDLLADPASPESHDPHVWFNVNIWMDVAEHVTENLAEIDPNNADYYNQNLESYMTELEDLDKYISDRVGEVDEQQRVLVTAHDAFNYFGDAYEFEVKGLQGISTEAEAGTGDVSELATFIADNKIKAIFVESSVPRKNVEALQAAVKDKGFEVEIGGELYSDSLGDETTGHDTYITTCKANIDTIVDALK